MKSFLRHPLQTMAERKVERMAVRAAVKVHNSFLREEHASRFEISIGRTPWAYTYPQDYAARVGELAVAKLEATQRPGIIYDAAATAEASLNTIPVGESGYSQAAMMGRLTLVLACEQT